MDRTPLERLTKDGLITPGPGDAKGSQKGSACLGPSTSWFWWLMPLDGGGGFGGVIVKRDEQILYIGCLFQGKRWSGPKSKLYWVDWPSYCSWYWWEKNVTPGHLFFVSKLVVRSIGEQDENREDSIWALLFQYTCSAYIYIHIILYAFWKINTDRKTDR